MELDRAEDYLIDDSGMGSDGELRRAIEILCELPPTSGVQMGDVYIGDGAIQQMDSSNGVDLGIIYGGSCNLEQTNSGNMGLAYQDACTVECTNAGTSVDTMLVHGDNVSLEEHNTRKRAMDEDCSRSKSKACREKLRRDKLNDRFLELSSALEPGRPPKSDKASILSDAARVLEQLKAEAQELKIANEKLQETIKDLKAEKNELRDEKTRLKEEKEKLEQQVKSMSMPPGGYMPHPVVIHPYAMAPGFAPGAPSPANKPGPFAAFPSVPMWQWMPSAFVDTTQDAKLWPPNA